MALISSDEAIAYHKSGRAGKLEVVPTKPCQSQRDLSLAYTPGVAEACRAIVANPDAAYDLTARGNLVGVVTNGTAVLGLGDIGPLAGKPVMEGKAVLFKAFADVDCFTIDLAERDPERLIETVQRLEPTFGGINLEDIKAPECFEIERRLQELLDIPVFHDDQHGTAIISGAALLNGLRINGKDIGAITVVISGAGAAAIACAAFYVSLGVARERIWMFDSRGLLTRERADLNPYKRLWAQEAAACSLAEALVGADVFLGCSRGGVLQPDMLRRMAPDPIVFACANPDPEIHYDVAKQVRPDCLMGTGRSDYPNQVNNVLGFPFIFRGALDVRARSISEGMKVAAAEALASLAQEPVPAAVCVAYGVDELVFGADYLIPKPIDPRIMEWESLAVARSAMAEGLARIAVDLDAYRDRLHARQAEIQERMAFVGAPQWAATASVLG